MVENDTLDISSTNLFPMPSEPPSISSYTIRTSEYYLEKLSNGNIYCKIYMIVGLTIAPSALTSNFDKPIGVSFAINLPITLSKVKYCNWVQYDTGVTTSFIVATLAPTKNSIHVITIQKVTPTSNYLTSGETNDIILKIEGII